MRFGASYNTNNGLLLVAKHILTTGLQKRKFTVTHLPLQRKYTLEVNAAKGLKQCQAKVKGVNNPA